MILVVLYFAIWILFLATVIAFIVIKVKEKNDSQVVEAGVRKAIKITLIVSTVLVVLINVALGVLIALLSRAIAYM